MAADGWQFWIDRGGTFTDIVARRPDGRLLTHKLLSIHPERYADAAVHGIRELLQLDADAPLPVNRIQVIKMGTTLATNALLERKGAPTLLAITRGFGDALRIGYQNRPRIFARRIERPPPLYAQVVEIDERLGADGSVVRALNLDAARLAFDAARGAGIEAISIVLMHGYRHPRHERALAELAGKLGFTQISVSHEVSPLMKLVSRGDTTVADAYLSPVLRAYVHQLQQRLTQHERMPRLLFMQSHGGLIEAERLRGKDALLSGPAGGLVGAVHAATQAGFRRIISFDMGGTSTDVAHHAGDFEYSQETELAGMRLRTPMLAIDTVAAGGGSILHFDGTRYRVGPHSAGADPGPACYHRGGPLTVTDANLMLGRIQPDFFPQIFGPHGDEPLARAMVDTGFAELAAAIRDQLGDVRSAEQVAAGFRQIAVENMVNAIKKISVARGHEIASYTLVCFGGAGGQHACAVADELGMQRIFIHALAGVLSAYGIGMAALRVRREQAVEAPLGEDLAVLDAQVQALTAELRAELLAQQVPATQITTQAWLQLRYAGTDTTLSVALAGIEEMVAAFAALHRQRFGFTLPDKPLIVEALTVEAVGQSASLDAAVFRLEPRPGPLRPRAQRALFCTDGWQPAPIYDRTDLRPGDVIVGPALICDTNATTVVEPYWRAEVTPQHHLLLSRTQTPAPRHVLGTAADPVMLEIFNNRFMAIAEQMGSTLEKTAHSVNIKERLDFSCALFTATGELVANAPHIPVHLGSMGDSVRAVLRANALIRPGDVYALNDPYHGGTHLPDITVVTPMFDETGKTLLFWVASRGHHADIGGITPGSMPPYSRHIGEEGVLLDNFRLVSGGHLHEAQLLAQLIAGPYPARNPAQNLADLKAQIAANQQGLTGLRQLIDDYSLPVVQAYMRHVQDNAEAHIRRVIAHLRDGHFVYPMDDGSCIVVSLRIDPIQRRARIDFTGTSAQQPNNFNAPQAICRAAVLYVFRTLVNEDIPLNEGCLKPLELVIPQGSLLSPTYPAAVVAGNVEISQAVVDCLYGALGILAAAQGTMNNVTFGDERHQYYETICGGAGAGPDFAGYDAVQTHMTNSRLTDPEVLEWRYPVRVEAFAIRRGSGGRGRQCGGDGVIRKLCFLVPMTAAILSSHRRVPNFGLEGGEPGQLGRNYVLRRNGHLEALPGTTRIAMQAGDCFIIETPGGGGFGKPA